MDGLLSLFLSAVVPGSIDSIIMELYPQQACGDVVQKDSAQLFYLLSLLLILQGACTINKGYIFGCTVRPAVEPHENAEGASVLLDSSHECISLRQQGECLECFAMTALQGALIQKP